MEMKIKKKERREPDSEPNMRYFKIPLCRIFHWNVKDRSGSNDVCQWYLRSKIGVWQMPLFKFLRHGDLKENFKSTGRRDLNIKYTNFD